jgi:hypothetical protein
MLKASKILLISTVVSLCLAIVVVAQNAPAADGRAGGRGGMRGWSEKNYVFVPAAAYNGNRFKTIRMNWPTVVEDKSDRYHDIAPIIPQNLPHLNIGKDPSKLSIKTNSASTPAIAFFSPEVIY